MNVVTERVSLPRWLFAVVVVVFLALTGVLSFVTGEEADCNEALREHMVARARWAEEDRQAFIRSQRAEQRFWLQVYQHRDDRQANMQAFHHWIETFQDFNETVSQNSKRRAQTSLPALASCD